MLTEGNKKLGREIMSFSLPNISTCPGRSELCERLCYVDNYQHRYLSVKEAYNRNYQLSLNSLEFVRQMTHQILMKKPEVIRIHASGDFYSNDYIQSWIDIARDCPDTRFYAYTRSWNVIPLRFKLREFGLLENVELWMSWDRDMPNIPASMSEFKIAYMTENNEEEERIKRLQVQLVFRNNRRVVSHRIGGAIVCPLERGKRVNLSCSSCRICF